MRNRLLAAWTVALIVLAAIMASPAHAATGDVHLELFDYNTNAYVLDCAPVTDPCSNFGLVSGHAYMIYVHMEGTNPPQAKRLTYQDHNAAAWTVKSYTVSYNDGACSGGAPAVVYNANIGGSWELSAIDDNNCIYGIWLFGTATSSVDLDWKATGQQSPSSLTQIIGDWTTP